MVRFLDTRGLDERAYEPDEDIRYCESQAHLVLAYLNSQGPKVILVPRKPPHCVSQ